ncbi:MAG: SRPBCC family protein [Planctomycetota bacterium]
MSIHAEFEQELGSKYFLNQRVVGGFDTSALTLAPLRSVVIAKVHLSREAAFQLMLTGIHEWFPGVEEFVWTKTDNGRIVAGSVRTGNYKGSTMVEPILYIEDGYFYVYQIDLDATTKFIPIQNHLGIFTVEALSDETSLVVWRQYFDNTIPLTGKLIAWVMEDRTAEPAFDSLVQRFGGERIEYW